MRILLAIIAFTTFMVGYAHANTQSVKDTSGVTRAEQDLGEATESSIEFSVVDAAGNPADDVEILLKNSVTGETLTARARNGNVFFDSVPAGLWIVSTATKGITFVSITISPLLATAGTGAAAVGGGVAGLSAGTAGGVVAVTVAGAAAAIAANNEDDDPISPFL